MYETIRTASLGSALLTIRLGVNALSSYILSLYYFNLQNEVSAVPILKPTKECLMHRIRDEELKGVLTAHGHRVEESIRRHEASSTISRSTLWVKWCLVPSARWEWMDVGWTWICFKYKLLYLQYLTHRNYCKERRRNDKNQPIYWPGMDILKDCEAKWVQTH